jgi:hypothetical protein
LARHSITCWPDQRLLIECDLRLGGFFDPITNRSCTDLDIEVVSWSYEGVSDQEQNQGGKSQK